MKKVGASDWTIGKLMVVVLAVVVLVLLSFGVAKGMVPSIEKIGDRFDGVIGTLKFWGEDSSGCYNNSVLEFPEGKDFVGKVGVEGKGVVVERCSGVCSISGEGLGSYRVKEGVFEKLIGKDWRKVDVIEGDVDVARKNWEEYNSGYDLIKVDRRYCWNDGFGDKSECFDIEESAFFEKFVLYGDGNGLGEDVIMIWQNGEWEIRRGPVYQDRVGKCIGEDCFGSDGRKIIYSKLRDFEAFEIFYNIVTYFLNDNVYWKVLTSNQEYSEGEGIGSFISSSPSSENKLDSNEKLSLLKLAVEKKRDGFMESSHSSSNEIEKLKGLKDFKYYGMSEKEFKEAYKATLISRFLNSIKC